MPLRANLLRCDRINGTFRKGKRGLGIDSVTGRNRRPLPAARRKAFMNVVRREA
jgi:hypothetical protein